MSRYIIDQYYPEGLWKIIGVTNPLTKDRIGLYVVFPLPLTPTNRAVWYYVRHDKANDRDGKFCITSNILSICVGARKDALLGDTGIELETENGIYTLERIF